MSQSKQLFNNRKLELPQMMVLYFVAFMVLLNAIQAEARTSSYDPFSMNNGLSLNYPLSQIDDGVQSELTIEKAINYAVDLGCKNIADMIARAKSIKDSNELVDLVETVRLKKALPKHTPRFGR